MEAEVRMMSPKKKKNCCGRCLLLFRYSFICSGYFYSAYSSLLLLRGAPGYSIDTVSELAHRNATDESCE